MALDFHRGLLLLAVVLVSLSLGCNNSPYPEADEAAVVYYSSFSARPKTLDPAVSYSSDESIFVDQVVEPPLEYHFLKRPYQLVPLVVTEVPTPVAETREVTRYVREKKDDKSGKPGKVVTTIALDGRIVPKTEKRTQEVYVYRLTLIDGLTYGGHPCFAKGPDGKPAYEGLTKKRLDELDEQAGKYIESPYDFPQLPTRAVLASDFVNQMQRLADPVLNCPIASTLAKYMLDFSAYAALLTQEVKRLRAARRAAVEKAGGTYNQEDNERDNPLLLDRAQFPFPAARALDDRTYEIVLDRPYPQFRFWLAMHFFGPMPPEAERFFKQKVLKDREIELLRYPIGTGAFRLIENDPMRQITLEKNPDFRDRRYPSEGEAGDKEKGLLADAGKKLPFFDRAVYRLEREFIPRWHKFHQGYYDLSAIGDDVFDQAVSISSEGPRLTDAMKERNIRMLKAIRTATYYFGFNMDDDLVGGLDEKKCKLRQAIGIAIDTEEYIGIFANGRGIPAQSPVPPGIFGYEGGEVGLNRYQYEWRDGKARRRSLEDARRLIAEAGYPGGRDPETRQPLKISFDNTWNNPSMQPRISWMRQQFAKLGIVLDVQTTDYNRFREKMDNGTFQFYSWGWLADYPDPENFLFLLYGPNAKSSGGGGENSANYKNPEYDKIFEKFETMPDSPERLQLIKDAVKIVQHDTPWVNAYHPVGYTLAHEWYKNAKVNMMSNNTLQFKRVDAELRAKRRREWNQPVWWPLAALAGLFLLGSIPAVVSVRRKAQSGERAARQQTEFLENPTA